VKDLAPDIVRQRLLVEGLFDRDIDERAVKQYLTGIAAHLGLRTYGEPIVHSPSGAGKEANEGFDAFIPLIDSGISLYVWSKRRFFAAVLFTCKRFDETAALEYTREFFAAQEIASRRF
jgi:S-adenosylmethionine decarboxylase